MGIQRKESVKIATEQDVSRARLCAQRLTHELHFKERDQIRFMTAISELTRNVVKYAEQGTCDFFSFYSLKKNRIEAVISDQGPGIANLEIALKEGFSTKGTLGCGLSGTRQLVDEFHIQSDQEGVQVFIAMEGKKTE